MRLLVTRPEHDAARTARELEVRGHTVVLAPLMRIETIDADLDGEWGAVLMTSANAAHALAAHRHAAMLRDRPVFTVGDRTADAAREAGFTEVASADGALADLARLVSERCAGGRTLLLYAAGEDRAGDLSSTLGAHGIAVRTIAVYRAHAQKTLPATVTDLLRRGDFDGVLHYSRRSSETFLRLSEQALLLNAALSLVHYCLSAEVAAPLEGKGARRVEIAAAPNETSLFGLLGTA